MRKEVIGDATLYLGDFRDLVGEIPTVDLVATDPPYGIAYVTNYRTLSNAPDPIANDAKPPLWCVGEMAKMLRNGGAMYLCTALSVLGDWNEAVRDSGLSLKTPIIWDKGNWTAGDLDGDFGNQVEIVVFAHKGRHRFTSGRKANLWSIPRPPAGDHPTPKPVGLMAGIIECSSVPGDLVLDPFFGIGTTAVAALRVGRRFVGCEIDPKYFDLACRRLDAAARQNDMFAQVSA